MIAFNHFWMDKWFFTNSFPKVPANPCSPAFPQTPTGRPILPDNASFLPECLNSRFHVLNCANDGDVIFLRENAIITEPQARIPQQYFSIMSGENGTLEKICMGLFERSQAWLRIKALRANTNSASLTHSF